MGFSNNAQRLAGPNYLDVDNPFALFRSKVAFLCSPVIIESMFIETSVEWNKDISEDSLK